MRRPARSSATRPGRRRPGRRRRRSARRRRDRAGRRRSGAARRRAGRSGRAAARTAAGRSAAGRRRRTRTSPGGPPPHGHGLVAATSRKRAGSTAWLWARETRITPSSSGSRSPSSAAGANSPSSSRNSTPPWARQISPGPQRRRAAADEGDRRAGVVRRPERRRGDEPAARHRHAGRRVDHRGGERRRRGRAAGAGRAGAGRASSCPSPAGRRAAGGDRRRRRSPAPGGRPAGRARRPGRAAAARRCRVAGPGSSGHGASPVERGDDLGQRRGDPHAARATRRGPRRSTRTGTTAIDVAEHGHHRGDAGHPAQRAVEAELADEAVARRRRRAAAARWRRARRRRWPGRARRPILRVPGRGEVDRDATASATRTPRAQHGGPDPVARLAARRVGHADDAVPGQAVADVDLDADRAAGGAEQAGGRDGCEHGGPPTTLGRIGGGDGGRPHDGVGDGTNGVSRSRPPAVRRGSPWISRPVTGLDFGSKPVCGRRTAVSARS